METKRCLIFAAGEYPARKPDLPEGTVIAADAGWQHAAAWGVTPQIVIGDFDSADAPTEGQVIRLNPIKDETDTLEAVRLGLERGCNEFHIYGATGGRTAHTFANIQTLVMLAEKGARGFLISEKEIMTVIHNAAIRFDGDSKGYVSVFSLKESSAGVCEKGLKYTLNGYEMRNDYPIGVSNEFTGSPAEISVADGTLLVIYSPEARVIQD